MRPYIFIFLLSQMLHLPAWGQGDLMISDLTVVPFSLTENDGTLNVLWSKSRIQSSYENFKLIEISDIRIDGIDLFIDYKIPNRSAGLNFAIKIGMSIEASDSTLLVANRKELTISQVDFSAGGTNTMIWRNIIGGQIDISENYTLLIRSDIYGTACAEEPTLNLAKQLPYYGGAVLGLGMIGAGQLIKGKANRSYESYRQLWENGNENDQNLLDDVNKDNRTANLLTYAGVGVLCLDAALYYLRNKSHRKAVKRYNTFCIGRSEMMNHPKYNSSTNMGYMLGINFNF